MPHSCYPNVSILGRALVTVPVFLSLTPGRSYRQHRSRNILALIPARRRPGGVWTAPGGIQMAPGGVLMAPDSFCRTPQL